MIRAGFLSPEDRAGVIALARDGSAAHRLARRANALVLLDDGWSCEKIAGAFLLDDDTIRQWHGMFVEDGFDGLARFETGGSDGRFGARTYEAILAYQKRAGLALDGVPSLKLLEQMRRGS